MFDLAGEATLRVATVTGRGVAIVAGLAAPHAS